MSVDDPEDQGPLRIGETFQGYDIRELIGRGGHAWVYNGYKEFIGRDAAVKIIYRPGAMTKDVLRRAKAEAQLLNRLRHPNIVEVFDAGVDEGRVYIIMELLRGLSFREVLRRRGRLTPEEMLAIFPVIADAVEHAHQANAIHRDLKPDNVFIVHGNVPKVLDFGIAKVMGDAWTTQRNIVLGTMAYMSPEQIQGMRVTRQSDVYALGLMAYEALSGIHPCQQAGIEEFNIHAFTWFHVTCIPPPLDDIVPGVPRYVARAVSRAIAKSLENRFASMADFAAELRQCDARLRAERMRQGRQVSVTDLAADAPQFAVRPESRSRRAVHPRARQRLTIPKKCTRTRSARRRRLLRPRRRSPWPSDRTLRMERLEAIRVVENLAPEGL